MKPMTKVMMTLTIKNHQQLFRQMGHDSVRCQHWGVELIERTAAVFGRQHSEKHSHFGMEHRPTSDHRQQKSSSLGLREK